MKPGSEEWTRTVAANISLEADAKLEKIIKDAIDKYGSFTISHDDTLKLSFILNHVQHNSFMLGVQMTMEMMNRSIRDYMQEVKVQ